MRVGIASDDGGFALKERIADLLRGAAHEVVDFGAFQPSPGDDYPDYVNPPARTVPMDRDSHGRVRRLFERAGLSESRQ